MANDKGKDNDKGHYLKCTDTRTGATAVDKGAWHQTKDIAANKALEFNQQAEKDNDPRRWEVTEE